MTFKRLFYFILSGLILVVSLFFLQQNNNGVSPQETVDDMDRVDYKISGFTFTAYDSSGHKTQQLQGDEMSHYPIRQHYLIQSPRGEIAGKSAEQAWQIQSETLLTNSQFSELDWQNSVQVTRRQADSTFLELRTESLKHHLEEERFFGETAITVRQSSGEDANGQLAKNLRADQFDINVKTGQLNLTGSVNATYE